MLLPVVCVFSQCGCRWCGRVWGSCVCLHFCCRSRCGTCPLFCAHLIMQRVLVCVARQRRAVLCLWSAVVVVWRRPLVAVARKRNGSELLTPRPTASAPRRPHRCVAVWVCCGVCGLASALTVRHDTTRHDTTVVLVAWHLFGCVSGRACVCCRGGCLVRQVERQQAAAAVAAAAAAAVAAEAAAKAVRGCGVCCRRMRMPMTRVRVVTGCCLLLLLLLFAFCCLLFLRRTPGLAYRKRSSGARPARCVC